MAAICATGTVEVKVVGVAVSPGEKHGDAACAALAGVED